MINLNDVRLFLETARLGSLSAAGRSLGRTPAMASAGLKRLEAELGVRLIERNTRSLRLTPEGVLYREQAASGLAMLERAHNEALAARDVVSGEIRLTAPVDFARIWLRPILNAFQEQYPQVHVTLLAGDPLRNIVSEPFDLAIRYGELPDSAMVARRLSLNRRVVVGAPAYFERYGRPRHPQDLKSHNCLIYMRGDTGYRRWIFRRGRNMLAVDVSGNRSSNDGSLVREWALDGIGLAYKSELDVRQDIAAGWLEPLFREWRGESAPLNLLFPGAGPRPERVRRLADFIHGELNSLTYS